MSVDLSFDALHSAFTSGTLKPSDLVTKLYRSVEPEDGTFVALAPREAVLARCRELESVHAADRPPLWGILFAVKDNIDVEGFETTAACKAFAYRPHANAPAVQALLDAGAVFVGKTNMDQFATGLVGTRTPYGTAPNAFDPRFIPGGSSSGSGAAVGAGLVSFALGTDTAGSGRIPAGFNGCVGLKGTVGRVSTTGVVPAAASLDCLTCLATTVRDAATVLQIMGQSGSVEDPNWRVPDQHVLNQQYMGGGFSFGIPNAEFLDFGGPGGPDLESTLHLGAFLGQAPSLEVAQSAELLLYSYISWCICDLTATGTLPLVPQTEGPEYQELFGDAVKSLEAQGGRREDISFSPFAETAKLLYESAFIAERYSGIRTFLEQDKDQKSSAEQIAEDPRLEKVIGAIFSGAVKFSAADVYDDNAKLKKLKGSARAEMAKVDLLLVPTALHHYTVQEMQEEEQSADKVSWSKNAKLGRFTNFVNLLDMCAVSVPSAVYQHPQIGRGVLQGLTLSDETARRRDHLEQTGSPTPLLPFGVTLIAPAWRDNWLCEIASRIHQASGLGCGPTGHLKKAPLQNGHA